MSGIGRAASIIALAGVFAAGCGTPAKPAPAPPHGAPAASSATATPAAAAPLASHNVIVQELCGLFGNTSPDITTVTLHGFNPTSWLPSGTTVFHIPKQTSLGAGTAQIPEAACDSGVGATLSFDQAHTKVAVTLRFDNGASHVGYVDAKGKVVDVTALATPAAAFGNLPKEQDPVFNLSGTRLWFIDQHRFVSRDIAAGATTDEGPVAGSGHIVLVGTPERPISLGSYGGIPNSDGTAVASIGNGGLQIWHLGPGPRPDGTGSANIYRHSSNGPDQPVIGGGTAGDRIITHCRPLGWTGPHTILCDAAGSAIDAQWSNYYLVDIGDLPNGAGNSDASASLTAVLPQTNRSLGDPLLSPDGRILYFVSAQQAFQADTTRPGAQPTAAPAAALSVLTSGRVVGWQP